MSKRADTTKWPFVDKPNEVCKPSPPRVFNEGMSERGFWALVVGVLVVAAVVVAVLMGAK